MNPSRGRSIGGIVFLVLVLMGGACTSSTPLKKSGDAGLTADLDANVPDTFVANIDAARIDAFQPTDGALSFPDASPDVPSTDVLVADTRSEDQSPADSSSRDTAVDRSLPCTFGANQTCNDVPLVSSIWGTCQPDGTCLCAAGMMVNPATGRCMVAPILFDASVVDSTVPVACSGDYNACSCGCCGGVPMTTRCYYPSLGETAATMAADDLAVKSTTDCNLAGCSSGTRYVCCEPAAPESPSQAKYVATHSVVGTSPHLHITKTGADCASLDFDWPTGSPNSAWRISATGVPWAMVGGSFGACGEAGASDAAVGAVGTLSYGEGGTICMSGFLSLHVTLFAFTAAGEIKTARLDVDGLGTNPYYSGCPGAG
jgi:hypothetical protein